MFSFFRRIFGNRPHDTDPVQGWTPWQRRQKRMSGYEGQGEEEVSREERDVPAPLQDADEVTNDLYEDTTDPFAAPGFDTDEIINSDFERKGPHQVHDEK